MLRNQFVLASERSTKVIAPQRKVSKSQKKDLTWALGDAAAVCNRSYLCIWDRVTEEEDGKRAKRDGE